MAKDGLNNEQRAKFDELIAAALIQRQRFLFASAEADLTLTAKAIADDAVDKFEKIVNELSALVKEAETDADG